MGVTSLTQYCTCKMAGWGGADLYMILWLLMWYSPLCTILHCSLCLSRMHIVCVCAVVHDINFKHLMPPIVFLLHIHTLPYTKVTEKHWEVWYKLAMAQQPSVTVYQQHSFAGFHKNYFVDQVDISSDFPSGVGSARMDGGTITVFELPYYRGKSAPLPPGEYPDNSKFPGGTILSLKIPQK